MPDTDEAPPQNAPIDAVVERLNDPATAAALVTVLDNAELLSTLVLGLSGLVERSETIMDSVAEGVHELRSAEGGGLPPGSPSVAELTTLAATLSASAPLLNQVLQSDMADAKTVELLSMVSGAATEGAEKARRDGTTVVGIRGVLRMMRDPEVQRGLGLVLEVSRALGRRLRA